MAERGAPKREAASEKLYRVTVRPGHNTGARSRSGIEFAAASDTIVPESRMTPEILADEWLVVTDAAEPVKEIKPARPEVQLAPVAVERVTREEFDHPPAHREEA